MGSQLSQLRNRHSTPPFLLMSIVAKRLDGARCTWYGGRPGSGDIVLDADPASPRKGAQQPPLFGPCLLWPNGWMDQVTTWYGSRPRPMPIVAKWLDGSGYHLYGSRPRPRRHCVRWGPSSPPRIGAQQPPVFDPCLLWPNGWMNQDTTWYRSRPRFRRHCVRLF